MNQRPNPERSPRYRYEDPYRNRPDTRKNAEKNREPDWHNRMDWLWFWTELIFSGLWRVLLWPLKAILRSLDQIF